MYFKLGCVGVMLISLLSCGLQVGEKRPGPSTAVVTGLGYKCVGQIPEYSGRYLRDELDESEITNFVRCLQRAFVAFAQYTRGRDVQVYSPNEIREFLHSNFLRDKDKQINDTLLAEFMLVKQVLVGGESQKIARKELSEAIDLLETIRDEAIRLRPHIKYINPTLALQQDPGQLGERIAEANEALRLTVRTFSNRLQESKVRYPIANLQIFTEEMRRLVKWESYFTDSIPVKNWMDFLKIFKEVTVSERDPNVISPSDWKPLLEAGVRWYSAYLQYEVGVKNRPVLEGVGLQNLLAVSQEVFAVVEQALNRQPTKFVSYPQMVALARAAQGVRWIPSSVRVCSIETTLRALFSRVFGDPASPSKDRRTEGLGLAGLSRLKEEFYRWANTQSNLESQFRSMGISSSRRDVPALSSGTLLSPEVRARLREVTGSDWDEFIKVRKLMRGPLFSNGIDRVFLVSEYDFPKYNVRHDFPNLSRMNILRSLTSLMFRGYANDGARSNWGSGLKSADVQRFYEDIRPLGIDLGIIDKRNFNAGTRAFIEGNLFTYAADGYRVHEDEIAGQLNFVEAMELTAFLYSGSRMGAELYKDLQNRCASTRRDDDGDGSLLLDQACTERELPSMLIHHLPNMPGLTNYLNGLAPSRRDLFAKNILGIAHSDPDGKDPYIESSEITVLSVVLHYAETIMTRFDLNGDGVLNDKEIEPAAKLFVPLIRKVAASQLKKDINASDARKVFLYILQYKEVPKSTAWWDWLAERASLIDYGLGWNLVNEPLAMDRFDLSMVFRVIISELFKTQAPTGEQPKMTCS